MNPPIELHYMSHFQSFDKKWQSRVIDPELEEVEIVLDGKALIHDNGQVRSVNQGHLLWHRPGDKTIFSDREHQYSCLLLIFRVRGRSLRESRFNFWSGAIPVHAFAEDALSAMTPFDDPLKEVASIESPISFAEYLYHAVHIHSRPMPNDKFPIQHIAHSAQESLRRAKFFIDTNFQSGELNIDYIAAHAYISPSHLYSLFKKQYGISPHQHIRKLRLEKAIGYLKAHYSIKQTAALCGFGSTSGFVRAFKKEYGIGPKGFS